jgi:hypothetical protein
MERTMTVGACPARAETGLTFPRRFGYKPGTETA